MSSFADPLDRVLAGNQTFAAHTTSKNPHFFKTLATGQTPEILWIGCADSRVPETTICACAPGDIFVHRNIANCVLHNDTNSAAVIEYAVTHLKVKKVVICGHTKCGGAAAALGDADLGVVLNTWLHPIRELRRKNRTELEGLASDDERAVRVAELNVAAGVEVVKGHEAVKKAVDRGVSVHGAIFDLETGSLRFLGEKGGVKGGLWRAGGN